MPDNSLKTRLGKRLKAIYQSIPQPADQLFDLCCDHGALGRAVLESQPACHVTFNDINVGIMQSLQQTLQRFNAKNYSLHTGPAQEIRLPERGQSVIVLAGIGDEQSIAITEQLLAQETEQPCRFIISPATKVHYVRRYLASAPASLITERLVTENRRTYEILYVIKDTSEHKRPISAFGEQWQQGNRDQQQHLWKLIQFYSAQQRQQALSDSQEISNGYQEILKKISLPT